MSLAFALILNATVAAPASLPTAIVQGPDLQAAFVTAYGEAKRHHVTLRQNSASQPSGFTLTPQALIHDEAGFFLVALARNDQDCHACASGLALTAFANVHGKPGKITGRLPFVESGTGLTQGMSWLVSTGLTRYPALRIDTGWTGQGCASDGFILVELATVPVVRADYVALTKDDMENDCCRVHMTGKLMLGTAGDRFAVRYSGWTRPAGHRRQPINRTVTWHMKDGRFVADATVVGDLTC